MEEKKLKTAMVQLMLRSPFLSTLLLSMETSLTEELPYPAATDGARILMRRDAVRNMPLEELITLIAHEVLHTALMHPLRMGPRNLKIWNQACDYAVNWLLDKYGFRLPEGALYDRAFADMSAEEIYNRLYRNAVEPEGSEDKDDTDGQQDQGPGAPGSGPQNSQSPQGAPDGQPSRKPDPPITPGTPESFGVVLPPDPEEAKRLEGELKVRLAQAAQAAKNMGQLPAELARAIQELLEPKVPWRELLRRFITMALGHEADSWVPPNRRLIDLGIYLPGRRGMPDIAVAVDTSGSISRRELDAFAAEIASIAEETHARVTVIYCDADIRGVQQFMPGEPVTLEPRGGGGTDFRPVFDYIAENMPDCAVLVYMTDLEGRFPEFPPPYPVIWAATTRRQAPFGVTIHLEE